jgi:hypothetical protein
MITIHVGKEIHASLDEIWNLVSDIDREPESGMALNPLKILERREI